MNRSPIEQAINLHQEGKLEEAEKAYLDIIVDEPDNAEALKLLGIMACQQDDLEEGLAYLEAAIGAKPEESEYHLALGRAKFDSGDHEGGINSVLQAGEKDPGRSDVFATLGYFFQRVQDFPQSQSAYERAVVIEPENIGFRVGAGLSAFFAGEAETAQQYLSKAYETDNSMHQAAYGLALLNADAGDKVSALSFITNALIGDPNNEEYQRLQKQLQGETA